MEIARIGRDGLTRYLLRQMDHLVPDGGMPPRWSRRTSTWR